ncbi:MAG TPA: nucleotide sugar dehydrogenase [Fimbriimonadaceae bacterium]|nr:nucleotide sugar dehydrogenase [Fimbriimonadaceae bacterium]
MTTRGSVTTRHAVANVEAAERILVVGLGYIGLPTSLAFTEAGFEVVGFDVNAETVRMLNSGELHIHEAGLQERLDSALEKSSFRATGVPEAADVFIIAVPTPCSDAFRADLSYVRAATESVAQQIQPGNMVVLESTVPPGTTESIVGEVIRQKTGLSHEDDYDLVHCPERVIPGRIFEEIVGNSRVIGGTTVRATERAAELYSSFVEGKVLTTDARTAEMAKLMENAFRDVNIALANEFRSIAELHGIDVLRAIELANHHPRVHVHQPGIGVGGHCIPVDPWFLISSAPGRSKLLRTARELNASIPLQVSSCVLDRAYSTGAKSLAFYGLAFKPNVDDLRESPAIEVVKHVASHLDPNVRIAVIEPFAESLPEDLSEFSNVEFSGARLPEAEFDLHVGLVAHDQLRRQGPPTAELERILDFVGVWGLPRPVVTAGPA